ncbi:MAG: hypothetical protein GF401_18220 [Chitinivibrionales bacterium]|nr:hypothetical protein [Chitinivibrionales bacterium]
MRNVCYLILFAATIIFAENDSLLNLDTPAPLTLIQNGRHKIYQLLENGEIKQIQKLHTQMYRQIDTSLYNIFTPYEIISFDLLFGRFFYVSNLDMMDTITKAYYNKAPAPNDALLNNMQHLLKKNKLTIEQNMEKLNEKKFDFCNIFLHWLISDARDTLDQNTLNYEADRYLEKHPEGEYADFVRLKIRYVYRPSNWGFGLSFFSGLGLFSGGLEDIYSNAVLLGHSFDFFYKKFGFVFYNQFQAATKLKDSIIVENDIWPQGVKLFQFSPAIHFGYLVLTKRVYIFPYIGIASHSASIADADTSKYKSDAEIPMHSSPVLGVTFDWKLAPTRGVLVKSYESGSWTIRTDLSVMNTRHNRYDNKFSGYLVMVKIGIGGIAWPIKRDGLPKKK